MPDTHAIGREREFWDEHVPDLAELVASFKAGPDVGTAAMLAAVEPLDGAVVLDFACGAGLTTAWLASRGARVVGLDLSPASVARGRELCAALDLDATFVASELGTAGLEPGSFDRLVGRYALHHVNLPIVLPQLRDVLRPGGVGSFYETMGLNPILRFARQHLVTLPGVRRFGSEDERPLTAEDLRLVRDIFGELQLIVPEMRFLRILDRNTLYYRLPAFTRLTGWIDDRLDRPRTRTWSYHQVVRVRRVAAI